MTPFNGSWEYAGETLRLLLVVLVLVLHRGAAVLRQKDRGVVRSATAGEVLGLPANDVRNGGANGGDGHPPQDAWPDID